MKGEKRGKTLGLPGASLEARIHIQRGRPQAAVAVVAAVEHTAKATPTQRMNGRQREGFLYVPLTRIYVSIRR